MLLLVGPPGIGKTTLAHVLANQAGYRPVEINASDDRATSSFKQKLIAATEMQNVFGDKRPNLLIIDEVDGLPAGEAQVSASIVQEHIFEQYLTALLIGCGANPARTMCIQYSFHCHLHRWTEKKEAN